MENFVLKFLWLEKSIAVALDQRVGDKTLPLTEYFFWPQKDAWEEIKVFLESKPWISSNDAIYLLNQVTDIINFWQDKSVIDKKDFDKVKEKFENCQFVGFN